MRIFDTHSHYDDEAFDQDRDELIKGLKDKGISRLVTIGVDRETSENAMELARTYRGGDCPEVYAAIGYHPENLEGWKEESLSFLEKESEDPLVVAVGEIGLDYHWMTSPKEEQAEAFRAQIQLAKKVNLPIVVHTREAAEDTKRILWEEKGWEAGGVIHCYPYSVEMAKEYVSKGFYLGIGGVLTFKNARKLVQVVEEIPLEHLILETDCPYLTPVPFRGKRNDSGYLPYVIQRIAALKEISVEEVAEQTYLNACRMYQIEP